MPSAHYSSWRLAHSAGLAPYMRNCSMDDSTTPDNPAQPSTQPDAETSETLPSASPPAATEGEAAATIAEEAATPPVADEEVTTPSLDVADDTAVTLPAAEITPIAPFAGDSFSEAPTVISRRTPTLPTWRTPSALVRRMRARQRMGFGRIAPIERFKRGGRGAMISLGLLLILGIPLLLTVVSAAHDYTTLKGLGESGISHLLAVKSDLTGHASSSASSTSSTLSTTSVLAALHSLLATPGPAVSNPAYTYLAQRQSGTFYPVSVTVQPAKGVAAEGSKPVTFNATIAKNTYFALGGQPIATPTPTAAGTPTATPTTTPTATATAGSSAASSSHLSSIIPDAARIAAAVSDLRAAESDFQSLGDQLAHPDTILALVAMFPIGSSDLSAVQTLAQVGIDVAQSGLALLGAATPLLTRLHGSSSLLSGAQKLITSSAITSLQQAMTYSASRLDDAAKRLATVNVGALPLSAHQKALFTEFTPLLPQITALLPQASAYIGLAGWMLGVGQPRHFLVQTLDRGEMRASGGFTGQYGVLTLSDGKLAPFSLQDVNCLDYLTGCLSNGWIFGRRPPAPYNTWWPFANWGLRDSNLSADFPTDARLVMDVYQHESGQQVDGLIEVSPIAIEDVLRVTGPIQVPLYGETITADNLETKLHYYQQDPAAIAKEKQLSAGDTSTSSRKRFTQLVGQLLQERIKALPMSELAPLAIRMLGDMRSKDLEVYVSNPQIEKLLTQLHVDGAVNTTPGVDGYLLVQTNVSVSKATSFVTVTQHDNETLDSKGGATHNLTLTFSANYTYNQVYGYLTYRDYLRIYTPPQSQLLGGDGFDSGQPLCWPSSGDPTQKPPKIFGTIPTCDSYPYVYGELVCPSGNYAPGPQSTTVATQTNPISSDGLTPWALDNLGGPTSTTSDIPNRAMYAGYVVVPDYCTATVTLSRYTPNVEAMGGIVSRTPLDGRHGRAVQADPACQAVRVIRSGHARPGCVVSHARRATLRRRPLRRPRVEERRTLRWCDICGGQQEEMYIIMGDELCEQVISQNGVGATEATHIHDRLPGRDDQWRREI